MVPLKKRPPSSRFAIALLIAFAIPTATFVAIDASYFAIVGQTPVVKDFEPDPSTTGSPTTTGGSGTREVPRDQPPVNNSHRGGF